MSITFFAYMVAEEACQKHTLSYGKYFIMHCLIQKRKERYDVAATTVTILTAEWMKSERILLSKTQ